MQVTANLAVAGGAIFSEEGFKTFEVVCFWAKVAYVAALFLRFTNRQFHFRPRITVKAVTFNTGSLNVKRTKYMLQGLTGCGCASTRRTGDCNNWVLNRHVTSP